MPRIVDELRKSISDNPNSKSIRSQIEQKRQEARGQLNALLQNSGNPNPKKKSNPHSGNPNSNSQNPIDGLRAQVNSRIRELGKNDKKLVLETIADAMEREKPEKKREERERTTKSRVDILRSWF